MDKKNRLVVVSRPSQGDDGNIAPVIRKLKRFRIGKKLDDDSIWGMVEEGLR